MRTDPEIGAWAKALFEVALATEAVDRVAEDLRSAVDTVAGHRKLNATLRDPGLSGAHKGTVVLEVFGDQLAPVVVGMMVSLAQTNRHDMLPRIQEAYEAVSEEARNVAVADVTTVVALDDGLRAKLTAQLEKLAGKKVVLREHVDETVLGGAVVRIGGKIMDGSVRSKLAKMREQLVTRGSEA